MLNPFPRVIAAAVLVLAAVEQASAQCPGDIVPNGVVNGVDLAEVLATWGPCTSCNADTNGDGQVNGIDLTSILSGWGPCRPIVTSIGPSVGLVTGGSAIWIAGRYLSGVTSVSIGGNPATDVVGVSDSLVTAVTPAGVIGPVAVVLATGSGAVSVEGGFVYVVALAPPWSTLIQAEPDPGIVEDPALRSAILSTGHAWRVRDTATHIEFVLIPPGTYQRGCSASQQWGCLSQESPVHQVTLTQPFYMGRYEVTQAQWQASMGSNPSWFRSASAQVPANQVPNRPVEWVSWNMVQGFLSATGMRLPTEAEWEYAYRAGTTTAFHSMPGYPNGTNDDSLVVSIAWFGPPRSGNAFNQTRPVGQLAGNGFGLHDMAGNVWEWVSDWYGEYREIAQIDPVGPRSGVWRVARGGAWYIVDQVRASARGGSMPEASANGIGFRVVRNP